MRRWPFAVVPGLVVLLVAGTVLAKKKVMYVKVRAAKLKTSIEPGNMEYVGFLKHGTKVEVVEQKGDWLRVLVPAGGVAYQGWVHTSQVQAKRPPKEALKSTGLTKMVTGKSVTGVDATKGAASRQLLEGQKYANSRRLDKEYEVVVGWMEHLAPGYDALDRFMQEGGLGPYRGMTAAPTGGEGL